MMEERGERREEREGDRRRKHNTIGAPTERERRA
jgi:hypothetical protein